jgi:hypothetical protein
MVSGELRAGMCAMTCVCRCVCVCVCVKKNEGQCNAMKSNHGAHQKPVGAAVLPFLFLFLLRLTWRTCYVFFSGRGSLLTRHAWMHAHLEICNTMQSTWCILLDGDKVDEFNVEVQKAQLIG